MSKLLCIVALLLAACEEEGRYRRPDMKALFESARPEDLGPSGLDVPLPGPNEPARKALWDAVERAEAGGLVEMYGVESQKSGDDRYRALFFLKMRDAGAVCLYADSNLHAERKDAATVPWAPVDAADLTRLGRRVAAQFPPERAVSLTADVLGGTGYLLHVYAGGESRTLVWFEQLLYPGMARVSLEKFRRAYPGHALIQALWASAPVEVLPESREDYQTRPGWKPQ